MAGEINVLFRIPVNVTVKMKTSGGRRDIGERVGHPANSPTATKWCEYRNPRLSLRSRRGGWGIPTNGA
jgi:hypothetical protein